MFLPLSYILKLYNDENLAASLRGQQQSQNSFQDFKI